MPTDAAVSEAVSDIKDHAQKRPTRAQAEEAVRTLIAYVGEHPFRPGLLDTPKRVVNAYEHFFSGYASQPEDVLTTTFSASGYEDFIALDAIPFVSSCEHHLLPFSGHVHLAYLPGHDRIVGLSKLARVVGVLSKRMQVQERLTVEVAEAISGGLEAAGVAVVIEATHQCMAHRGVEKHDVITRTSHFLGAFKSDSALRDRWLAQVGSNRPD